MSKTPVIGHYINGQLRIDEASKLSPVYNPAQGRIIKQVALASHEEVEEAIAAAQAAYPAWAALPPIKRARILFKYKALLEENMDELAALVTEEHGKTLPDAKGSILRGIEAVEVACGIPQLLKGWFSENVGTHIDSYTLRQPLGVCAGITPFNFPAMIPLWMFPMAVACGNTFVLKPSEKDPSCSLRLAALFKQAGAPDGVLNVINGDKEAVDVLLTHPKIAAVSFVGSTLVAEHIHHTASIHGKRVQAFGGAKNHAIVMPDADMTQAANAVVGAAYGSAGERCMAISVVIAVGEHTAEQLLQTMIPKIKTLKIGCGTQADTEMGPLISLAHLEKVKSYIDIGIKEGAKLLVDGRGLQLAEQNGYYLGACLFDQVTPAMRIYKDEIFGPILCMMRAPDFDTALQWINGHEYGNGTAIFTRSGFTARTFASRVEVGMIGINVPIPVPTPFHAFGGWKRSIFADTYMHGTQSVNFYTKLKTITSQWLSEGHTKAEFMMKSH